jgi:hypothetical protein
VPATQVEVAALDADEVLVLLVVAGIVAVDSVLLLVLLATVTLLLVCPPLDPVVRAGVDEGATATVPNEGVAAHVATERLIVKELSPSACS